MDLLFYYMKKLKDTDRPLKVSWTRKRPDFGLDYIFLLKLELFCFLFTVLQS